MTAREVHLHLKRAAAERTLAEGRRLVWTDDDAIPEAWLAREDLAGRALLVAPRPGRGLQPEHLDLIEAFVGVGSPAPGKPV
ncbi:MAG TPA: hypothetical protein VE781_13375 [Kineosporiaceae bacterium]|nr:hypothetical protein [Kineosporiaceae bacterium]